MQQGGIRKCGLQGEVEGGEKRVIIGVLLERIPRARF